MKKIIYMLILVFISLTVSAGTEKKVGIQVNSDEGDIDINVFQYINNWGRPEVRIESAALPRLGKINPVVGYGRDLDDDGRIETFFLLDSKKGIVRKTYINMDTWGIVHIRNKIFSDHETTTKAHLAAAYGTVVGVILMSVSHWAETERNHWLRMIDLEEFSIRTRRAYNKGQMSEEQWIESLNVIMQANQDTYDSYQKAIGKEQKILAGADVALWLTGGFIGRWIGKGIKFVTKPFTKSAVYLTTKSSAREMLFQLSEQANGKVVILKTVTGVAATKLSQKMFVYKFKSIFKAVLIKNMMLKKTIPMLSKIKSSLGAGLLEWKYLALLTGIQVGTETWVHWDEVNNSDPLVLAKNVMSNEDIVSNMGYQLVNSYLFTTVGHALKTKRMKFAACGFIAAANSSITNLVIRDSTDYKRVAFDTGYSMVVDTAQVMIDMKALSYFEALATKNKNPKLKLLGYAIVVVDTAIGLAGYSLIADKLSDENKQETQEVKLVPIMAETDLEVAI